MRLDDSPDLRLEVVLLAQLSTLVGVPRLCAVCIREHARVQEVRQGSGNADELAALNRFEPAARERLEQLIDSGSESVAALGEGRLRKSSRDPTDSGKPGTEIRAAVAGASEALNAAGRTR